MKRLLPLLILLIFTSPSFAGTCWNGGSSGSAPWTVLDGSGGSPSATYADVNYCVNTAASAGDAVNVTATGSATWATQLTLGQGIRLKGPGSGSLTITAGLDGSGTGEDQYLINFTSSTAAVAFEISGFTFNCASRIGFLWVSMAQGVKTNNIRIHHNVITNANGLAGRQMQFYGQAYGVIDNNTFNYDGTNTAYIISPYGNNDWSWANLTYSPGTADNIYLEDNTINVSGTNKYVNDCGLGGRVAFRYNTITNSSNTDTFHDQHGNMDTGGNNSCMGSEYYGNSYTPNNNSKQIGMRGGKTISMYNRFIIAQMTQTVGEQFADNHMTTPNASDGQPQHVSSTYYYQNYEGVESPTLVAAARYSKNMDACDGSGGATLDTDACYNTGGTEGIKENIDWFKDATSFDGTAGVGAGTLASRPATCTTGVGYWATAQSTSDLTGMVGKNPSTTIGGTLYKCTDTNTWTVYYTPYTYPHPLRGENQSIPLGSGPTWQVGSGVTMQLR